MPKDEECANLRDRVTRIETELKWIKYFIIASVGANIGIQFVGSPPWVIVATYLAFTGSIFLVAMTLLQWKTIPIIHKVTCLIFALFVFFSTVCRQFIYTPGEEPAPVWYPPTLDFIMIFLLLTLIYSGWEHRKYELAKKQKEANDEQ